MSSGSSTCGCVILRKKDGESTYKAISTANNNTTVLSGQLIDLSVSCGAGMYSNIVWTLPNGNFKDFQVVTGPGRLHLNLRSP